MLQVYENQISLRKWFGGPTLLRAETSSKCPTLEFRDRYRDLKIRGLCQYFTKRFPKNVNTTSKFKFFRISGIFLTCFDCFLPADTADKKHVVLQKFA